MSVVATVPSLRMNGDRYEIKRIGEKVYCDCPAASFGKAGTTCKHAKIFETAQAAIEACGRKWLTDKNHERMHDATLCQQCLIDLLATLAAEVEKKKRKKR